MAGGQERLNLRRLQLAILRGAALLAPGPQRAEWLAEWTSELWYVQQSSNGKQALMFCAGALPDALWLRRNRVEPSASRWLPLDSPLHCILLLAALTGAVTLLAFQISGARDMILPSPYPEASRLAMVYVGGRAGSRTPSVSFNHYRVLSNGARNLFAEVAYYQPARSGNLSIALASANLFSLLHVSVPDSGPDLALVLSESAWRKYFDGDPHVVGHVFPVNGEEAVVTAVIPDRSWRLPGRFDAWLLVDEPRLASKPAHSNGFVLARLRTASLVHWRVFVPDDRGDSLRYNCASLATGQPIFAVLCVIALACMILPAVTHVSLGEYPANHESTHSPTALRRWTFLALKVALIVPIVFFGTLDLATILVVGEIRAHGMFIGYVIAFRWILVDQRRRCPVCLRLLTHPTRIGGLSHTFLEWCGTEFMCARGHGLLHVPEVRASYTTQRWQPLDPSWSSLFS